jgi:hypothetical protein
LDNLTPEAKKSFRRRVIQKHTNYGAISTFKGVEEVQLAKSKTRAKNEILRIRAAINDAENEIAQLESNLSNARVFCFF